MFVSEQLVELWEHPEVPFGWSHECLEGYLERGAWVLLFNAVALTAGQPRAEFGS